VSRGFRDEGPALADTAKMQESAGSGRLGSQWAGLALALVFVRLRAIRGIFSTCNAFAKEVF
jgi:hypothetical protein